MLHLQGVATSGSVQAILHFQTCTMRMMYKHIAEALAEYGNTDASVTDYLQFYCLGNREAAPQEITVRGVLLVAWEWAVLWSDRALVWFMGQQWQW